MDLLLLFASILLCPVLISSVPAMIYRGRAWHQHIIVQKNYIDDAQTNKLHNRHNLVFLSVLTKLDKAGSRIMASATTYSSQSAAVRHK